MAEDEKIINVALRYTTNGADEAARQNKIIEESTKKIASSEDSLKRNAQGWVVVGESARKADLELNKIFGTQQKIINGWTVLGKAGDVMGFDPAKAVGDHARLTTSLENELRIMKSLKETGRELSQVGQSFTIVGGIFTAAAVADAKAYVNYVGQTTKLGAEWLSAEERIKKANLEIGESTARVILPAVQEGAVLMERIAQIAESHPWLVQGIVGAGGIFLALGAATKVIGEIAKVTADMGLLLSKLGLKQAESLAGEGAAAAGAGGVGATLGTVALYATAVIIGAEIGAALGNWLGKIIYGESYKKQNIGDALVTLEKIFQLPWVGLASILNKMGPAMQGVARAIMDTLNSFDAFLGKIVGASQYKETAAAGGTGEQDVVSQQAVQSFINYQKELNAAQENYSEQRSEIIKTHEEEIANLTQQYEQQRAGIISAAEQQISRLSRDYNVQKTQAAANYAANEVKAADDYNRQQAQAAQSFQASIQKSERDFHNQQKLAAVQHQRDMAKLEAEHNNRMADLAASRDALGLVKEQRKYQQDVTERNSDFQLQQSQRAQEHAQQIADMRSAFNAQRAEAAENYKRQRADAAAAYAQQQAEAQANYQRAVADARAAESQRLAQLDQQHKAEMQKVDQQEKEKLSKLDQAYKKQVDQLQTAFIDRLRALDSTILGDSVAFEKYMQSEALQFRQWLENFKASAQTGNTPTVTNANTPKSGKPVNTTTVFQSHAQGGYVTFHGNGEDGRAEFVANNTTTRAAENIIGSRLTQAGLLSAIMAGRNAAIGGGQKTMQINVTGRSLSVSEIRNEVDSALNSKLSDLLPAFGA